MIPLQINRARLEFVRPEGAAGTAEQRLVVDDLLAVQDDGDVAVHQGDVHGLPFAGGFCGSDDGGGSNV